MNEDTQRFVSRNEAAKILGMTPKSVSKLIKSGKVRAKNLNATGDEREYWKIWLPDLLAPDNITKEA